MLSCLVILVKSTKIKVLKKFKKMLSSLVVKSTKIKVFKMSNRFLSNAVRAFNVEQNAYIHMYICGQNAYICGFRLNEYLTL
jgi:hypothetical protein